jgi:hypothetical protein
MAVAIRIAGGITAKIANIDTDDVAAANVKAKTAVTTGIEDLALEWKEVRVEIGKADPEEDPRIGLAVVGLGEVEDLDQKTDTAERTADASAVARKVWATCPVIERSGQDVRMNVEGQETRGLFRADRKRN